MQRNTFTLNVQQNISSETECNGFAQYIDQRNNNVPYLSDGPLNANNGLFLANNIDQNILNPGYDPVTGKEIQFSDDEYVSNPWFVVNQFVNDQDRKRLITAATLKYNFTSWLYAQARMGYDLINDRGLERYSLGYSVFTQGSSFRGQSNRQSKSELRV